MKKNVFVLFGIIILFGLLGGCKNSKNVETLIVASERGDCVGVAPMKCLIIKKDGKTDWEYWYNEIEGFNYEPGFEYELEVLRQELDNPAADQSSTKYILKNEVSKTKKQSENLPGK